MPGDAMQRRQRAPLGDEAVASPGEVGGALPDRGTTVVPSCRTASAAGRYSLIATSRPSSESTAR